MSQFIDAIRKMKGPSYYGTDEAAERRDLPRSAPDTLRMLIFVSGFKRDTSAGPKFTLPHEMEAEISAWAESAVARVTDSELEVRFVYPFADKAARLRFPSGPVTGFDPARLHYVLNLRWDPGIPDFVVDELLTRTDVPDLGIPKWDPQNKQDA